jgi:secreted trypsin-like serine protease
MNLTVLGSIFSWIATFAIALLSAEASPLIIGGREAGKTEFPEVVDIETFNAQGGMSLCTASFVSDNTLLTAAHCVYPYLRFKKNGAEIVVPGRSTVKDVFISESFRIYQQQLENQTNGADLMKLHSDLALIVLNEKLQVKTLEINRYPQIGPVKIVGFGGKNLMTVSQLNQHPDSSVGVKRVGKTKLEWISPLGRMDSQREVYQARHWYYLNDVLAAREPHLALSSRGDSGGPLLQKGKIIGVISGVDITDQDEKRVYSTRTHFTGLHTGVWDELVSAAKKAGSSLR